MAKAARTVRVDLPDEAFQHRPWEPTEIAEEMRLLWLLEEVRSRRLGYGKAAELAGIPLARLQAKKEARDLCHAPLNERRLSASG